jgi:S-adenosylhomocysteine hydrolase
VREHKLGKRLETLRVEQPAAFPAPSQAKRPTRDDAGRSEMARAIGKKARALFDADVLITQADLIAALNRDGAVSGRYGKLTTARYQQLFTRAPSEFPQLADRELVLGKLADEIRALKRSDGALTPSQLTEKMRALHPRFRLSRVYQLRERFPGLIDEAGVAAVPAEQRRTDAVRLAGLMQEAGGARKGTIAAIATKLGKREPRFTRDYCYRLRREFEAELFSAGAIARRPPSVERSSLPVQELYALLVRTSPPGTGERQLAVALDRLLAARGLPVYGGEKVPSNISKPVNRRYGSIEAQSARVASAIVAEYAAAAPRGTAAQAIFEKVLVDYPSIDRQKLSTYLNSWTRSPGSYPALASFLSRGRLALEGKGTPPRTPRYLGGWDLDRALLGPVARDGKLAAELASASQYARIPNHLPLLDQMVADLKGKTPLRGKNVLWVSHLLATTVPLARALQSAGTLARSTIVVGTPYGSNPAVRETLAEQGFDVRVPKLSMPEYRRAVERALDDMVTRHRQNQKPVVVLDDGGLVSEILQSNPRYADVLSAFKIVEQTTRGITVAEKNQLRLPVVNVARSASKRAEGAFIGRAVAQKTVQGLTGLGRRLEGERATVIGYGVIGTAIAKELRSRGAKVTVVETSLERVAQARRAGFQVAEKAGALASAQIVIGATGTRSLSLDDLRLLPSGAVVASASSKQVELDMEGLGQASRSRTLVPAASPLVRLPTARYQLGRAQLTVLGDGWPVNFDGDVEDIPAGLIQITRALMFAGAIQAAGIKTNCAKNRGMTPLDNKVDQQILRRFQALSRGAADWSAHDPTRWPEVVREVAGALR